MMHFVQIDTMMYEHFLTVVVASGFDLSLCSLYSYI